MLLLTEPSLTVLFNDILRKFYNVIWYFESNVVSLEEYIEENKSSIIHRKVEIVFFENSF
jgi:hypothetical protein